MQNINTMLDRIKTPVRLSSRKTKGCKSSWNGAPSYEFKTDIIIITAIYDYGGNVIRLIFFDGITNPKESILKNAIIEKDFQVEECKSVAARALLRQYDDAVVRELDKHIYHSCTVGSDPEIFVVDGDNKMIPSYLFLGSKQTPTLMRGTDKDLIRNLPLYWDGFQAEFETRPNNCLAYHCDSIQSQLESLLKAARKYDKDAKLSALNTFDIVPELLYDGKEEHVQFGCMPSLNAYGMQGNIRNGREVFFRSAGGHIHIGLDHLKFKNDKAIVRMVKAMDAILGVSCVSLFEKFDDPRRRQLYGLAGEYRVPKHGFEYRVLSNAWMCHPYITNIVFDLARKAMMFGARGLLHKWECDEQETIRIINQCDVEAARKVMNRNKDLLIEIIGAAYGKTESAPGYVSPKHMVFDTLMNGIHSAVADPMNIEKNWKLNDKWVTHCDLPGKNVQSARKIITELKQKVD